MRLKRYKNATVVAIAMAGLMLVFDSSGCSEAPDAKRIREWRQAEADQRHLHQGGKLHFEFDSVRCYRTNWANSHLSEEIVTNGKLNEASKPLDNILLTTAQVKKLEAAITGSHPEVGRAMCFQPHHAFVFFDKDGVIVGNIDICFLCSNYYGSPGEFVFNWDLLAIAEVIHELGIPLSNPDWDKADQEEEDLE
ncbi:MAG: hypothetical protein JNL67_02320 [Planctomycetaceae bacterium]|nr:hypothetical protein [Planctomycetaceae bacterium]